MKIEPLIPGPLKNPYRRLRSALKNGALGKSNAQVFEAIYRRSLWGEAADGQAYSGSGTYDPSVETYVAFLRNFIKERQVKSIVEIGCGDFAVGRQYADDVQSYLGVDVSAFVIERNKAAFGREGVSFECADASEQDFPRSDLCIIRQVLQHLDNAAIVRILARSKAHGYVLVTEHLPPPSRLTAPNIDKRVGPDTRVTFGSGVYLEAPPFNREGEIVLSLPVSEPQAGPGEVMRTTLLTNF
jgi:Methyltransferase domain